MPNQQDKDVQTTPEARAKLSELVTNKRSVSVSLEQRNRPNKSMGQWLVSNMANLGELELPDRNETTGIILHEYF